MEKTEAEFWQELVLAIVMHEGMSIERAVGAADEGVLSYRQRVNDGDTEELGIPGERED